MIAQFMNLFMRESAELSADPTAPTGVGEKVTCLPGLDGLITNWRVELEPGWDWERDWLSDWLKSLSPSKYWGRNWAVAPELTGLPTGDPSAIGSIMPEKI